MGVSGRGPRGSWMGVMVEFGPDQISSTALAAAGVACGLEDNRGPWHVPPHLGLPGRPGGTPGRPQDAPSRPQEPPRTSTSRPKPPTRLPKMPTRRPQDAPEKPPGPLRETSGRHWTLQKKLIFFNFCFFL